MCVTKALSARIRIFLKAEIFPLVFEKKGGINTYRICIVFYHPNEEAKTVEIR